MKIYHEAPLGIFNTVRNYTNGDYALVHLLHDDRYRKVFEESRDKKRDTILDNSVFELGEAFDDNAFATEVLRMQPTWYIVPDVLEDYRGTVKRFNKFIKKFPELPGRRIGVVQGKSDAEILKCYYKLEPHCDMIAFSFDHSHWEMQYASHSRTREEALMVGRQTFLKSYDQCFNHKKPHHLLGCALPQEMQAYRQPWIRSVDTSNPVLHGLLGITYSASGLKSKESLKMADVMFKPVSVVQRANILYNMKMFRRFCDE